MNSTLNTDFGYAEVKNQDKGIGAMLGIGFYYDIGPLKAGGQFMQLSRDGKFNNATIATGSSQIQAFVTYVFETAY